MIRTRPNLARCSSSWASSRICGTSRPAITDMRWEPHASCRKPRWKKRCRGSRASPRKPVVSVGRFTSPDTMLRLVRQGVVDLVGAARPSIADPFLPRKIDEGRDDEIRECIGCNICYSGDQTGTPIGCTQNPTMGEEWRKGWHPEHIPSEGVGLERLDRRWWSHPDSRPQSPSESAATPSPWPRLDASSGGG